VRFPFAWATFVVAIVLVRSVSAQEILPEIVVTANRTPQALQESGSAISVVTSEDIARSNPTSLVDVLRSVPGLDISENGGPGATSGVRLRGGTTGHTLVMIDGIRVNDPSAAGGDFEFALVDPGSIERIEVLRGPQSALYGSDAVTGVINIITKNPGGTNKGNARVEAGRYGTATGTGSMTGSSGPWSYAMSVTGQTTEGFSRYGYRIPAIEARFPYLDKDGFQRFGGMARLGFDAGQGVKIETAAMKSRTRSEYDAASGTFPDTPALATRILEQYWARVTAENFGGMLTHNVRAFVNRTERDFSDVTVNASRTPTKSTETDSAGTRSGVEYQGDVRLGTFGSAVYGGKVELEKMTITTAQSIPIVIPTAELLSEQQQTNSVFGLYQLPLGSRLTLSLGGRIDDVPGVARFETWRSTAAFQVPETGTKFRASGGTGAKAPTLYQLYHPTFGNPALQPEHSIGWDAGFDQNVFGGRGMLSFTAFSTTLSNLIEFDSVTSSFFNVSKAETSGIEIGADVGLVPGLLRVKAAYTYLRAIDAATGLTLQRRPRQTGRLAFPITPTPRTLIEPRITFVSKRFSGSNETLPLDPYTRVDAYAEYRMDQNWRVFVRAENIFNVRYQEIANYGTTGQAFYGGISVAW
jgi:vitamin B12 transporter